MWECDVIFVDEKKEDELKGGIIGKMLFEIKQLIVSQGHVDLGKIEQEEKSLANDEFNFMQLELKSACNVLTHPLAKYELQKCTDCNTLLYRNAKDSNFS